VDVAMRWLFESPTVASLSDRIEAALKAKAGLKILPIEPVSRDRHLPLSFAQQRLWFLDQLEPNSAAYNIPAAVRIVGNLSVRYSYNLSTKSCSVTKSCELPLQP
jgi:hypothetical protein